MAIIQNDNKEQALNQSETEYSQRANNILRNNTNTYNLSIKEDKAYVGGNSRTTGVESGNIYGRYYRFQRFWNYILV